MGSNLSRQSERKEEKREDFAVYDAQNYRKLCEKYMLVNYIEIHFGLNVGKPRENFSKPGHHQRNTFKNFSNCQTLDHGGVGLSRNSSDSCWEHCMNFILD